jgi:S-adenosylmethionine synthetase
MSHLFTSESVTAGHPDKLADAISDGILDALLEQDPQARVAVETMVAKGVVLVSGEVTTQGYVEVQDIIRRTIAAVGYDSTEAGIDGGSCGVLLGLGSQSPDIALGVDRAAEAREAAADDAYDLQGAGDQGMMFGYACDETPALMPLPIDLAHRLAERLAAVRQTGLLDYLLPDGKCQATIRYQDGRPAGVDTVVVSAQHRASVELERLRRDIVDQVVRPTLRPYQLADDDLKVHVNPTGRFVVGGPAGDVGLTGRKIIVDTYGGMARHGGGAFSGKDPSKVDRSASYALRWVAKNVVAAGLARRCEVQAAYAIGRARPVSLRVDCFGSAAVPEAQIERAIGQVFDLRPAAIVAALDLLRPIYSQTTNYGHFGRELPAFTWERTDRAEQLARAVAG